MTAKIKLNAASGGGSFSLQAPSSSSNNRVFTLPDIADATMATVNGITEVDMYHLTTSFTGIANPIASNWTRSTVRGANLKGSGVSQSSGIFTFPATGYWHVQYNCVGKSTSGGSRYMQPQLLVTLDNSTYNTLSEGLGLIDQSNSYMTVSLSANVKCTDVSQVKVACRVDHENTNTQVVGDSSVNYTYILFFRMGDL